MVNVANQTHAGILNLIAQAVSPRDVETAIDLRAEAVARTLRIVSAQISHLEPARREEADEQYCRRPRGHSLLPAQATHFQQPTGTLTNDENRTH